MIVLGPLTENREIPSSVISLVCERTQGSSQLSIVLHATGCIMQRAYTSCRLVGEYGQTKRTKRKGIKK